MLTNQSIGYMDALVPKDINLKEAIDKLRKEKKCGYPRSLLSDRRYTGYSRLCRRQPGTGSVGG